MDQHLISATQAASFTALLPDGDRERFAAEAAATLKVCSSTGCFTAFAELVEDWRNTAEIWSDPALAAALSGDISKPLNQPVQ